MNIITDVLRKDLGFDGVVITDAMDMAAIAKHFDRYDAARLAIEAGVDILLMSVTVENENGLADFDNYIDKLTDMVEKGGIDKTKVDQAVKRILTLKEKKGLLNMNDSSLEGRLAISKLTVGCREHHDREWELAKAAVTLIKNDGGTLPVNLENVEEKTLILNHDSDYTVSAEFALDTDALRCSKISGCRCDHGGLFTEGHESNSRLYQV